MYADFTVPAVEQSARTPEQHHAGLGELTAYVDGVLDSPHPAVLVHEGGRVHSAQGVYAFPVLHGGDMRNWRGPTVQFDRYEQADGSRSYYVAQNLQRFPSQQRFGDETPVAVRWTVGAGGNAPVGSLTRTTFKWDENGMEQPVRAEYGRAAAEHVPGLLPSDGLHVQLLLMRHGLDRVRKTRGGGFEIVPVKPEKPPVWKRIGSLAGRAAAKLNLVS